MLSVWDVGWLVELDHSSKVHQLQPRSVQDVGKGPAADRKTHRGMCTSWNTPLHSDPNINRTKPSLIYTSIQPFLRTCPTNWLFCKIAILWCVGVFVSATRPYWRYWAWSFPAGLVVVVVVLWWANQVYTQNARPQYQTPSFPQNSFKTGQQTLRNCMWQMDCWTERPQSMVPSSIFDHGGKQ